MRTYLTITDDGMNAMPEANDKFGHVHWVDWREYSFARWFLINASVYEDKFSVVYDKKDDRRGEQEDDREEALEKKWKERAVHTERIPRLLVKHLLLGTSLMEVEHNQDNELTDESLTKVLSLRPPIAQALIEPIRKLSDIEEDEEYQIERESLAFFSSRTKGGVEDPCYALHLHAVLAGFWESYGLNFFDLMKLSVSDGVRLREVMQNRASIQSVESSSVSSQQQAPLRSATGGSSGTRKKMQPRVSIGGRK